MPADHLEFDAELVSWKTPQGEQTVEKYRLEDGENNRRGLLQRFDRELIEIAKPKPWPAMSGGACFGTGERLIPTR